MIINDAKLDVQTSEITSNQFRIKASKKAFDILSRKIYSDPVTAIIRELSTNASDALIVAKKDMSFKVHLPNNFEPYFFVRDDGTGMSDEQINTLYTTYFDSDKTITNDLNGALGLGSKSPFSYADSFTVESRYQGMKRTYSAYINADGLPSLAKMAEMTTDECDGFEVRLPVEAKDFSEFITKAQEVLRWFKPLPVVTGAANFQFAKRDYLRQTPGYALTATRSYDSHVVMANVAYRVEMNKMRTSGVTITGLQSKILDWGIDIFVNNGDIDFVGNREEVSYDQRTVGVIQSRLQAAIDDIKTEVESDIGKAKTMWQARLALGVAKHSILGQVRDLNNINWNGQPLLDFISVKKSNTPVELFIIEQQNSRRHRNKGNTFKKRSDDVIHADGRTVYVDDLGRGSFARIIADMKSKNASRAYLIEAPDGGAVTPQFLTETGLDEVVVYTSKLPAPPKKVVNRMPRRKGVLAKLNEWQQASSQLHPDFWTPADVDLSKGGVYVEILYYRYRAHAADTEMTTPSHIQNTLASLDRLGYKDIKVYGIRPGDVKMLARHADWLTLEDFVKKVLAKESTPEMLQKMSLGEQFASVGDSRVNTFGKMIEFLKPESLFARYLKEYEAARLASQDVRMHAFRSLYRGLGNSISGAAGLQQLKDQVGQQYPLLNCLEWYKSKHNDFIQGVITYIDAVDNKIMPRIDFLKKFAEAVVEAKVSSCAWEVSENNVSAQAFIVLNNLIKKRYRDGAATFTMYEVVRNILDSTQLFDCGFQQVADWVKLALSAYRSRGWIVEMDESRGLTPSIQITFRKKP